MFISVSGYAADDITHCIRPQDVKARRAVIIVRRYVYRQEHLIQIILYVDFWDNIYKVAVIPVNGSNSSLTYFIIWLCLIRTGNYRIREFDWLKSILTVV